MISDFYGLPDLFFLRPKTSQAFSRPVAFLAEIGADSVLVFFFQSYYRILNKVIRIFGKGKKFAIGVSHKGPGGPWPTPPREFLEKTLSK